MVKKVALPLFPVYPKINKLKICVHTTCDSSEQKPSSSNKYTMHFATTMILIMQSLHFDTMVKTKDYGNTKRI